MARGWLLAWDVVLELDINGLTARHPLIALERERPGADHLLNLLHWVDQGLLFAHDEGNAGAGLGQDIDQQAIGLGQGPHKGLGVLGHERGGEAHQLPASTVALAPAVHRGDDVLRGHRGSVVELEAVTQLEGVDLAIVTDSPGIDHLRFGVEVHIAGEQRVVDHQAVNAGDGLRRPEGVERANIGVHHGAQDLRLTILRQSAPQWR